MASPTSNTHQDEMPDPAGERSSASRRKFLTYMVAAPTLTLVANAGVGALTAPTAGAAIPSLPSPPEVIDLGDLLTMTNEVTHNLMIMEMTKEGRMRFELPRTEVGQGIETMTTMLISEEMDMPMDKVDVVLSDARPELMWNQLTGGSNTTQSLYNSIRQMSADIKAKMMAAAAERSGTSVEKMSMRDGTMTGPDGNPLDLGELSELAANAKFSDVKGTLKKASEFKVIGKRTLRTDALAAVTGRKQFTLDMDIPGALPCVIARPPSIKGGVSSFNEKKTKSMPGVVDAKMVSSGVAIIAETFGEAIKAQRQLEGKWTPGTIDDLSDPQITEKLHKAALPFVVPPLTDHLDAEFDFGFAQQAPLETNSAIADVRKDSATIWSGMKTPIPAKADIAKLLGLPNEKVTLHVMSAGGSFGRRLFSDAAIEAAECSKAFGRPVKLLWSRIDDMRHGRMKAATHHKWRATMALGQVTTTEHRMASVETDYAHGFGEAITAAAAKIPTGSPGGLPGGNLGYAQTIFLTSQKNPYNIGVMTDLLNEVPLKMNTTAFRSVYSCNSRGSMEMFMDMIAEKLGKDPLQFRIESMKSKKGKAVLEKLAELGEWGKKLPKGVGQGIAYYEEYKGHIASLIELDTRGKKPRVLKGTTVTDSGRIVNPSGFEAQMLGGMSDGISLVLQAGIHMDKGLPVEGSYGHYHYGRQEIMPREVQVYTMPAAEDAKPGGAGELGVPASVGATANAWARATGKRAFKFPIQFDIDFEPFPRSSPFPPGTDPSDLS